MSIFFLISGLMPYLLSPAGWKLDCFLGIEFRGLANGFRCSLPEQNEVMQCHDESRRIEIFKMHYTRLRLLTEILRSNNRAVTETLNPK
jgi:hypothetical protein